MVNSLVCKPIKLDAALWMYLLVQLRSENDQAADLFVSDEITNCVIKKG